MQVFLVRHGQSETNVSGIRAGQSDIPLTEQGYEDARSAGEKLKGLVFDRVFSSDLSRALETCRTAIGIEPETDKRLREVDIGLLAGHSVDECRAMFSDYDVNNPVHNYVPYGGENLDMIGQRVSSFMRDLEALSEGEKACSNIAVFAHYGTIQMALAHVLGVVLPRAKIAIGNGSVTIVEFKDGSWRLLKSNL